MDNQNFNTGIQNKWGNLVSKQNILILLGVVILLEVLWAGWSFYQTQKQIAQTPPQTVSGPIASQIGLSSDKTNVKIGEQFTVSATIFSDKATDGVDLIISFDPNLLSVETGGETKAPVILGSLYNEYPINTIDAKVGKITVSGISTQPDGITPNGLFGAIIFKAKTVGKALISLEFTIGSTADTNIVEKGTGQDILESVKNVTISINP